MDMQSCDSADLVASYWQTYWEWREHYGVHDACMDELRAAILVELDTESLSVEQRFRLQAIAALIQEDQRYPDRAA